MFVSVLICSRNHEQSLRRALESLLSPANLAARDWEVLVVDNGSTDGTPQCCRNFAARFPHHFRHFVENKRGKSNALNRGIGAVRGDVVAMTDDDVICALDYLQGIRDVFGQDSVAGAQGRALLDFEITPPAWFDDYFASWMALQDFGDQIKELECNLVGVNMIVRTEVIRRVGGFSPELGPGSSRGFYEDAEFSRRVRQAGFRLIYAPQILVRHQVPRERLCPSYMQKRLFAHGRSGAYLSEPSVPLWHYTLYALKELVLGEGLAIWHRFSGNPARALRAQCDARLTAGFCWQHWLFKRGASHQFTVPQIPWTASELKE